MDLIHPTYFKDPMNHFLLVIFYPMNKTNFIKKNNKLKLKKQTNKKLKAE